MKSSPLLTVKMSVVAIGPNPLQTFESNKHALALKYAKILHAVFKQKEMKIIHAIEKKLEATRCER